jgi:hypothetical protein
VLAFNDTGRAILKEVRESGFFVNIGEDTKLAYQEIERRTTALYGLFAEQSETPDAEDKYRIFYQRSTH